MRKIAIVAIVLLLAVAAWYFLDFTPPAKETDFKVVVLGFDGVDPDLVQQWIDDLPNIRSLSQTGTLRPLGTTNPPESPVAWASFATGTNPGKHGIFDFLRRDAQNYLPDIGLVQREPPEFLFGAIPYKAPVIINNRQGTPFWKQLDQAGYRTHNLRMPVEMPAVPLTYGRTYSGLGVPDLLGTWGTYHYLATDLSMWDLSENANTEFGGKQVLLEMDEEVDDLFHASIQGPYDPRQKAGTSDRLTVPLTVRRNEDATAVTISLQGREETVEEGQWSGWFEFTYDVGPFIGLHGLSRFEVLETFPEVRLYLMPISLHPGNPPVAITEPADYSEELYDLYGEFKTLGWIHETWGLNEEQIDEGIFLEDLFRNVDNLETMLLDAIDGGESSLYTAVFTATDSVSHMFYRLMDEEHPRYEADLAAEYGDAIKRVYQRMDEVIGKVRERLEPQDLLLVVSDHGFHTWRKEFNTNTWLVRNGYMLLKGQDEEEEVKKLDHMFSGGSFFPNVDWTRTKAYSLGLGHIYINLKGREGQGTVEPGQEYDQLVDEIQKKIVEFRDPDTDEKVLVNAYFYKDIYTGDNMDHAGDIQLSFATGYRTSWQTALGAVPPNIIVANLKKWSGDHCASDVFQTAGFLVSNRPITNQEVAIIDVAPTLYQVFGVDIPERIDGKPWVFGSTSVGAAGGRP
ncbi:MAG TPA: alkaline phosphatase family protein [Acidobacteriota bacterium]|nr:alkaline phosphatase family protein [Acidobacteriota bacterium]